MSESLSALVRTLLAAALFLGVLEALFPDGPVKLVGEFAIGLALFLTVAGLLTDLSPGWLTAGLEEELAQASAWSEDLEYTNKSYLEEVMSRQAGEYIQAQAESLGCSVTAQVSCAWEEDSNYPVPCSVRITGEVSAAQQAALNEALQTGLGLEENQIIYEEGTQP